MNRILSHPEEPTRPPEAPASTSITGATPLLGSGPETIHLSEGKYGPHQVMVRSGTSTFVVDEPIGAGGLGAGPSPFDLLSAALGSCALMTMRLYATERVWPLERLVVRVSHDRPTLASRDKFLKEIQIVGDLTNLQRSALLEVAMRCPIHLTVARGSDVETRLLDDSDVSESAVSRASHMRGMLEACKAG